MRLLSTAVPALAIALSGSAGARADECKKIHTRITTSVSGCDDNFSSPVGMCTVGSVARGALKGATRFRALTVTPQSEFVFLYTGDLEITTRPGSVLLLRDFGVLDFMMESYSELQNVYSGTGEFLGATGMLSSQGTAVAGSFDGSLRGKICLADEDASDHADGVAEGDDHEGDDHEGDDRE
jgi:hypothetical protein